MDTYAYIGVDENGRTVAACVDMPALKEDTAREVSDWIKDGLIIHRVTEEEARGAFAKNHTGHKMTDQQRIEELEAKLLEAGLQIGNLSEALDKFTIKRCVCFDDYVCSFCNDNATIKIALASIRPHIETQLKDVEEELEFIRHREWTRCAYCTKPADENNAATFMCDECDNNSQQGHASTCKLSARIGELEKKKAKLMERLK